MDEIERDGQRDLVVIGGSAGGVNALSILLASLPTSLPAAIVVVLHRPSAGSGNLRSVLDRTCDLPVLDAGHNDPLRPGRVYVAPPAVHVVVRPDRLLLSRTARVNRVRPAVDPLFRSAARWFGSRTIGVVLSGALDDGAAGLSAIWARGGSCLIQDPQDALFAGMPYSAMLAVPEATAQPAKELGRTILDLVETPLAVLAGGAPQSSAVEPDLTDADPELDADLVVETALTEGLDPPEVGRQPGYPVPIDCPDCRGAMTRIDTGAASHYRCHVGHSFSPQTLLAAQSEGVESALWTAVSILEEQAALHRSMATRLSGDLASEHLIRADAAAASADAIRHAIGLVAKHQEAMPEPE